MGPNNRRPTAARTTGKLTMIRPDQARFYQFSRHLELIDEEVYKFSAEHNLQLEKNLQRQPSRVLRMTDEPRRLLSVHLDGYWLKMRYEADLPHVVGAIIDLGREPG